MVYAPRDGELQQDSAVKDIKANTEHSVREMFIKVIMPGSLKGVRQTSVNATSISKVKVPLRHR